MNTPLPLTILLAMALCVPFRATAQGGTQPETETGTQTEETSTGQGGPGVGMTVPKPRPKTQEELQELLDEQMLREFITGYGQLRDEAKNNPMGLTEDDWARLTYGAKNLLKNAQTPMIRDSMRRTADTILDSYTTYLKKKKEQEEAGQTPVDTKPPNTRKAEEMLWDLRKTAAQFRIDQEPGSSIGYSQLGRDNVAEGNFREGASLLEKAVQLKSDDPRTYSAYGTAAYHLGDFKLAQRAASQALKIDPKDQAAFAVLRLAEGRSPTVTLPSVLTGAEGSFAAASLSGDAVAAPAARGSSVGAQNPGAASRGPSAAMAAAVQRSMAFAKEAAAALAVKDYLRAIEAAGKAIELNRNNAQAWNYRAIANSKLGRYEDAVKDASFALSLAPGNTAAFHTRSWALNKLGRHKEGLADADGVLAREPDNAFAYQNRAFALAGLGDRKGMMAALKRSAELDSRFKARYDAAIQAPENSDVLFLFDQEPAPKPGLPGPGAYPPRRWGVIAVSIISGGLLAALALLHLVSASWRERMSTAARRLLGGPAAAPQAAGGFWTKYRLVGAVGTGGMGVVYEALDSSLDRRVAIKKMRDEIRLDRRERERFLQEARTVASLRHPNIVEIYSIVEDGGDIYLVFEFAVGKTLHEVLSESGPLPFEKAERILKDACEAVGYAHAHKVVHRDIKPSNIMVTDEGAKVMDFGVARQAKDAATKVMTNTVVGTPPYMAPESEQGTVGPQSDVYGLGVVFYEMLAGKLPFAGVGAGMLLNKINGRFTPPSQAVQGLPAGIDEVMARVLAPDPARRYRTALEFISAVRSLKA
ncbi:MAG: protein kinase [Elusimicrobia bacterium]|nr:protein kinase [Elusimicrobiota bacterium]